MTFAMGTNIRRPNTPGKPALEHIFQNATAGKMHVNGKMSRIIIISQIPGMALNAKMSVFISVSFIA
jgi:hypothetical protein